MNTFFVAGLRDAERRLHRIVSPAPLHDEDVLRVVTASACFRTVASAVDGLTAAAGSSRFVRALRRGQQGFDVRRSGLVMLTAVLAHVVLMVWAGAPVSAYWLILPGIAAVMATVLIIGAGPRRSSA